MNDPNGFDKAGVLDELELGDRVENWLVSEMLGAAYAEPQDRAWSVVLGCYAKVALALGPDHPESLRWYPSFDENDRWVMP